MGELKADASVLLSQLNNLRESQKQGGRLAHIGTKKTVKFAAGYGPGTCKKKKKKKKKNGRGEKQARKRGANEF